MRGALITIFSLNLILSLVSLILCPADVAIHFGAGGEPNAWATAYANALIMTGTHTLIFISFCFMPHLIRIVPSRWINLPNKAYWLRKENRPRMESILARYMYPFGTLTLVFMFLIGLLALHANLSNPVRIREDLFWWVFGLYIGYTAYWTVKIILVFRGDGSRHASDA